MQNSEFRKRSARHRLHSALQSVFQRCVKEGGMRASGTVSGIVVGLVALLGASRAAAHHSFAPHFDSAKPVSISGTIKEYEARNPHSYIHINAVDENGRTQEYVCESHGVTQLTRNGI